MQFNSSEPYYDALRSENFRIMVLYLENNILWTNDKKFLKVSWKIKYCKIYAQSVREVACDFYIIVAALYAPFFKKIIIFLRVLLCVLSYFDLYRVVYYQPEQLLKIIHFFEFLKSNYNNDLRS